MFATAAVVFSLLLLITGSIKLWRPGDVTRALSGMGLRLPMAAGVVVGLAEVATGAAAILTPVGLGLQGFLYLAFAGWVLVALRLDVPLASCGCLGKDETPPSAGHLALNVVAAGVSLAAAAGGEPIELGPGLAGVTQITLLVLGVFLSYIVLTDGARLSGARTK